jgi:hypothetical protein
MNDDERQHPPEAAKRSALDVVGSILAGGGAGIGLGVVLVFVQFVVTTVADSHFPTAKEMFGPPTDPAGSLVNLGVELSFLGLAIGMVCVGIAFAKRKIMTASLLLVAALVLALPATACTVAAWTNVRSARAP